MAAIEREERGGAIAYRGVEKIQVGVRALPKDTNICLFCTADTTIEG